MEVLTITNLITVLLSISTLVHSLQEKFLKFPPFRFSSPVRYHLLRGSVVALAATQLATVLQPTPSSLATNAAILFAAVIANSIEN
jgi:hypothetical protein